LHTAGALRSSAFAITVGDRAAALEDVFPGFGAQDRLGIVVDEPCGGLGASSLVLAAVTGFYDEQRRRGPDFFIYPDYFVFHVEARQGDFKMLDVWPGHKEVVVSRSLEEIVRAVNDRGVTRLLVPSRGVGATGDVERQTRASATSRIVSALAYTPAGRTPGADVTVRGGEQTESYVTAVLSDSTMVPDEARRALERARRGGDAVPTESYRRLDLDDALALLAA
jgi:hypothetical protein